MTDCRHQSRAEEGNRPRCLSRRSFFRLNVVTFLPPPLRQRPEDILPLCQRALVRFSKEFGKDVRSIHPDAKELLERYPYPGNIRELENIVERALIFCPGQTLLASALPPELRQTPKPVVVTAKEGAEPMIRVEVPLGTMSLAEIESAIIEEVVRLAGFNKTLAAKHLGLTRFALDRRLKKSVDGKALEPDPGSPTL